MKANTVVLVSFLVLLIMISSCANNAKQNKDALEQVRTGTEGISALFLASNPPSEVHVEDGADNSFPIVLQVFNRGAYPQPEEGSAPKYGKVYLGGYDTNIIEVKPKEPTDSTNYGDLSKMALEGIGCRERSEITLGSSRRH